MSQQFERGSPRPPRQPVRGRAGSTPDSSDHTAADSILRLQRMAGNRNVARAVHAAVVSRDVVVSRDAGFKPTFGGDAGVLHLKFLNADIKLKVSIRNARSAPSGTTMVWSWGAAGIDGVEKGDISPATGSTATFNAKAKKPTHVKGEDELAANAEVAEPGKPAVVHPVKPPLRVEVLEPEYRIEQQVVPGAKGGGSPEALKPSDVLEFRVTFDNVDKPKELGDAGYLRRTLTQDGGL